ncbi:SDR family NAD(P)-dependent oxidoreductase [Shewanella gaetbuli]|uniref:SDR family NAD(P)-dependent oxidoreductase n=1 Tax=Shewanella gaetbuli TaxID=220752 RepID=A0A9X1ZJZ9_9GAMM|nr:SDR family NAD(P)-dependent oxidoreductase [Shewanella gaetbuli]MCL1142377.1 SDR family NAD(P)-dependent oxidoreductase [Shewanella gaetbuli]
MSKRILITGATDGIGFETAKLLVKNGHEVIIHGRNLIKIARAVNELTLLSPTKNVKSVLCDLRDLTAVKTMANQIIKQFLPLDVLINNAGVYFTANTVTRDNLDVRFMVNSVAPYYLTKQLLPHLSPDSRVINLSSAAQSPVNFKALLGTVKLSDGQAYAQSKLALTMWSKFLGEAHVGTGPMIVSVNPRSLLASKMIRQAYELMGADLRIGANILTKIALSDEFADAHGKYFDNDRGRFTLPHTAANDFYIVNACINTMESVISRVVK